MEIKVFYREAPRRGRQNLGYTAPPPWLEGGVHTVCDVMVPHIGDTLVFSLGSGSLKGEVKNRTVDWTTSEIHVFVTCPGEED